jgi:hypothetical protein
METLLKLSWADPQASDAPPRENQQPQVQCDLGWLDSPTSALASLSASPLTYPPTPPPRQPTPEPAPEPVPGDDFEARVLANMRKTQEIRRQLAVWRAGVISQGSLATHAPTVARL